MTGGSDTVSRSAVTRSTRRELQVAAVTGVSIFIVSVEGLMVPVALPAVQESFPDTAATSLAWMVTGYTIVVASLIVAMGRIGDRTGRLRIFRLGLLAWVLGAVLTASAPVAAQLFVGRTIQGVGHSMLMPSSLGLLLAAWPPERHRQALAFWITTGSVASALGPTLGAVVIDGPGWRWAFLLSSIAGLAAFVPAKRILVDTAHDEARSLPDLVGSAVLAAILALTTLVLVEVRAWGWTDPRLVAAAVVAIGLVPVFLHRTRNHPAPAIDPALFRERTYRIVCAAAALFAMVLFANLFMTTKLFAEVWGWTVLHAGLAIAPLPVLAAVGAQVASRVGGRVGERRLMQLALAATVVGFLWIGLHVDEDPDYVTAFLPGILLAGFGGWGMVLTLFNTFAVSGMSTANYGLGTAVLATLRQSGGLFGISLVFGLLTADLAADALGERYATAWLLLAGGTVVVAGLVALLPARVVQASRG